MESEEILLNESLPGEEQPRERKGALLVLAAFLFAASYLLLSIVPISTAPLGFLVLCITVYCATAAIALTLGGRIRFGTVAAFVFGIGMAAYRFIHGSFMMDFLNYRFFPSFSLSGLAYAYFVMSLFDAVSGVLSGRFLLDICKGIAFLFTSFADLFKTVFSKGKGKNRSSSTIAVVFGIIIALVLLLIVGSLLSYDEHFSAMLPKIELESIPAILRKLVISIPLCAMLFSLFCSARKDLLPGLSSEGSRSGIAKTLRFVPSLLLMIPVAAVIVLYVMFFISQWGYYVSAFTQKLPEGYSAAEYAREGFFQLLAVACVNAVLILGLGGFTKPGSRAEEGAKKALSILLTLATLVLIATAVSKMLLYIDMYDLTHSRLTATLFLLFMAAAFVFELLALIIPRMNAMPFIIVTALVMLMAFSLTNTDKLIADYNAEAYLSGKHESVDVDYLKDGIGVNSIDALTRLSEEAADPEVSRSANKALNYISGRVKSDDVPWYKCDAPFLKAKANTK